MASGSPAQTHRARSLSGQEVIVKIQRPGIDEVVKEDIQLLSIKHTHIFGIFFFYAYVVKCVGGFGRRRFLRTLVLRRRFKNEAGPKPRGKRFFCPRLE